MQDMSAELSPENRPEPADAAPRPTPLGEQLSRARVARGYSVEDVASQLKFAPRQIAALEEGRLDAIPGGAFARGMVRGYARLLRVDAAPLLAQLSVELPDAESLTQRYSQPVPFSDTSKRWNIVYAGLAIGALIVAGLVAYEWSDDGATPPAAVPVASQPKPPVPVEEPIAPPDQAAAETVTAAAPAQPAPAVGTRPASEKVKASAKAAANSAHRVVLRFERESWVQIRDSNGRTLLAQLNPAGTEQVVDSDTPLSLVIGNAQHVKLSLDGRPVDLLPYVKVEVARLTLP
jgi:cytoskeleton protein RodZ